MGNDNSPSMVGRLYSWVFSRKDPERDNSPAEQTRTAPATEEYAADEVVVKFRSSDERPAIDSLHRSHNLVHIERLFKPTEQSSTLTNIHRFKVPQGKSVKSLIEELKRDPRVEYAQPNYRRKPCDTIPNDVLYSQQWALTKIKAPQAWDIEIGDPNLVIAVVDSGIDYNHPDLSSRIWSNLGEIQGNGIDDDSNGFIDDKRGWSFNVNNPGNNEVMDTFGHGTSVAGIIGAATNNGIGVAGVNWVSKIMAVKFDYFDTTGAQAIKYAADNGAKIINLSFGGYSISPVLKDAVDYAYAKGCILVGAAGNDGYDLPFYPAAFKNMISVGGTNIDDNHSIWAPESSSNIGNWINLTAPGGGSYTTVIGINYETFSGTSASAPHVSGAASLVLSAFPDYTNEEVRQVLMKSVDDLGDPGKDNIFAYGRINIYNALTLPGTGYQPSSAIIYYPETEQLFTNSQTNQIIGTAASRNFSHFTLEYGLGDEPTNWLTAGISLENDGQSTVNNNLLGTINTAGLNTNLLTLRLKTFDQQGNWAEDRSSYFVDNMLKFNRSHPVSKNSQIIGADFDGGGTLKAVLNSDQSISMIDAQGAALPGWPKNDVVYSFSPPAIGDINNDGDLEIIAAASDTTYGGAGMLNVWDQTGKSLPDWPKDISAMNQGEQFSGFTQLSDIDDNGQLEIIAATNQQRIFVLDGNGNTLNGWPKQFNEGVPRLAIINLNGGQRLVAGAGKQIHVLKSDGSEEAGWPKTIDSIVSNVVVGDFENNGSQQIVVAGDLSSTTKKVWVFNSDGSIRSGWPVVINGSKNSMPSLSLGDIDNDGKPEILLSTFEYDINASNCQQNNLYVYDAAGNVKSGWPKQIKNDCSQNNLLVSDFNGDGAAEIVYATNAKKVFAWNGAGLAVNNYPRYNRRINYGSAILDMDGNGRKELLFANYSPYENDQELYVWEDPAVSQTPSAWPMARHDAMNTGNLNTDIIPPTIVHDPVIQSELNLPVNLTAQVTDNIGVRMARVFYKNTSSAAFQFIQMNNTGGAEWQGVIPATAATFDGIVYYISAQDSVVNTAKTSTYNITVIDDLAPAIDHTPITTAVEGLDLNISARISDNSNSISAAQLFFRISGTDSWQVADLNNDSNGFSGTIPAAFMITQGVDYYLQAKDPSDNVADAPAAAPGACFSISVVKDTSGPSITLDPVSEASAGIALLITADIKDDLSGVASATLTYRHKSKYSWKSVGFEAREGALYSAYIPSADMLEGEIEYYATAKDRKGNEGKSSVLSVKVIVNNRSFGCGCS